MIIEGEVMAEKTYPEKRYATLTPGKSVRMLRELHGLTQGELAKLANMTQATISAIETEAKPIGIERAKRLATALKVHPAVIAFPNWPEAPIASVRTRPRRAARDSVPA